MKQCEICDAEATRQAWYGNDGSRFGGGLIPMALCGQCVEPCNHHADPHAGYSHTTGMGERCQFVGESSPTTPTIRY